MPNKLAITIVLLPLSVVLGTKHINRGPSLIASFSVGFGVLIGQDAKIFKLQKVTPINNSYYQAVQIWASPLYINCKLTSILLSEISNAFNMLSMKLTVLFFTLVILCSALDVDFDYTDDIVDVEDMNNREQKRFLLRS